MLSASHNMEYNNLEFDISFLTNIRRADNEKKRPPPAGVLIQISLRGKKRI